MNTSIAYTQLTEDQIRLLILTPGGWNGRIIGSLKMCRLQDEVEYTALSYVWGQKCADDPYLSVNDGSIQIRRSLFEAITELTSGVQELALWVDQICINQNDDNEKQQQIRLMSEIYVRAQRVVGWLGAPVAEIHLQLLGRLVDRRPGRAQRLHRRLPRQPFPPRPGVARIPGQLAHPPDRIGRLPSRPASRHHLPGRLLLALPLPHPRHRRRGPHQDHP